VTHPENVCPQCGYVNRPGVAFCENPSLPLTGGRCGAYLRWEHPQPPDTGAGAGPGRPRGGPDRVQRPRADGGAGRRGSLLDPRPEPRNDRGPLRPRRERRRGRLVDGRSGGSPALPRHGSNGDTSAPTAACPVGVGRIRASPRARDFEVRAVGLPRHRVRRRGATFPHGGSDSRAAHLRRDRLRRASPGGTELRQPAGPARRPCE